MNTNPILAAMAFAREEAANDALSGAGHDLCEADMHNMALDCADRAGVSLSFEVLQVLKGEYIFAAKGCAAIAAHCATM